jgi:hypothetical protein
MSIGGTDPDHLTRYVMGRFDAPAFARRALAVAAAYEDLLARCRRRREELLREFDGAPGRFNAVWAEFLGGLDLRPINALRDGYNRYYLLEKECVVRSVRVAGMGFQPMAMLTVADLAALFPPLPDSSSDE